MSARVCVCLTGPFVQIKRFINREKSFAQRLKSRSCARITASLWDFEPKPKLSHTHAQTLKLYINTNVLYSQFILTLQTKNQFHISRVQMAILSLSLSLSYCLNLTRSDHSNHPPTVLLDFSFCSASLALSSNSCMDRLSFTTPICFNVIILSTLAQIRVRNCEPFFISFQFLRSSAEVDRTVC